MSGLTSPFEYSLEEFDQNPLPILERLREEAPVSFQPWQNGWFVVNWDDVETILKDGDTFIGAPHPENVARAFGGSKTILSTHGEEHRQIRASIEPPLRAPHAKKYAETIIRPIVEANIAKLQGRQSAELMADYFEPISVRSLVQILGIQNVDDVTLRRWFSAIVAGVVNFDSSADGFIESDKALVEIREVVAPHYERILSHPDDSTFSHMVHGGREGNPRTLAEILPSLTVYIAGGMQEPGHGAGSALYGLLHEPEQLARVKADPSLVARVVAEGLRWIPPIGITERIAVRDVTFGEVTIPAGDLILPVLMSANRDPQKFKDPNRFNIDRDEERIVSFGGGLHLCAGHFVARHVMRIAIEELLQHFPDIALDPTKESVLGGSNFRAPRTLYVTL